MLLRQLDSNLALTRAIARRLPDPSDPHRCTHQLESMLRQRIFGLVLGYEDLNDHQHLRQDLLLQTAFVTDQTLASQSTLCPFELNADSRWAVAIHEELVKQFIRSYGKPPKRLILDFDATDDSVHGQQVGRYFHVYYDDEMVFSPCMSFAVRCCWSAPCARPTSRGCHQAPWAILALLTKRLCAEGLNVQIISRGDSGFCRPPLLRWCGRHKVAYIVGITKNSQLEKLALKRRYEVAIRFRDTRVNQRLFTSFEYAAKNWKKRKPY